MHAGDFPLTLTHVLRRMRTVHGGSEVVTQVDDDGRTVRTTYADLGARIDSLAAGLRSLGVDQGDRVATLAWNSQEHLEAYYAVPCLGAVLHTVNLRQSPEQVAYTINHAGDRVLIVDDSLVAGIAAVLPELRTVEHVVVIGGKDLGAVGDLPQVIRYDDLLAAHHDATPAWPELDERLDAALCYTSGTTGNPKGVAYTHRTLMLHTLVMGAHDTFRVSEQDRLLSVVPMFHAMGWNMPYIAGMLGADLVLPKSYLQPAHLVRLIEDERVTGSSGVPTIWMDVLRHADEHHSDLSTLSNVLVGGTQVPPTLMRAFDEHYGVSIVQGWGMTEILPGATVAHDPPRPSGQDRWTRRAMAGRISPLYEVRITDEAGEVLPSDGAAVGEIEIRGPIVATEYYRNPEATDHTFHDGWLRTGDVGTADERGWLRITDRAKDVIKSGGEWISSADLESELLAHPAVLEAAVIAVPDPRWSERPLACVVTTTDVAPEELNEFLAARFEKWWLPDRYVFLDALPRTGTGKFDKKMLRSRLARGHADA
ncbi:long-chain fatty acid--CoA ligase [Nocardioides sp. zg-ZUI104]|uniref:long-chain fatty acid--CoA ligase n=1 Tax=Nocardioides faecalis TaxID=2803858 RepID=UPI001BCC80AE|nr:long-chain fatty acid--CoA ligase [Nocardioides faecalis]MBS4752765.1 long-chain fatty acid--CoA ligase [Nocardioides faecalis]